MSFLMVKPGASNLTQPTILMRVYTTAWRMLFNIVELVYDNSFLEYHRLKCLEVLSHQRSKEGIKSNLIWKSSGC